MTTAKAPVSNSAAFLVAVYDVAYAHGEATQALVALLKTVNWKAKKHVASVAEAFRLARIASSLKYTREQAQSVAARAKPPKDMAKANDKHRTVKEHKAYRAAVSAWSHAMRLAEAPNQVTGKARTTKNAAATAKPGAPKAAPSIDVKAVSIPSASTTDDVRNFALSIAALIHGFRSKNPKAKYDDFREVLDGFTATVKKLTVSA